jgi:hypothetical protein
MDDATTEANEYIRSQIDKDLQKIRDDLIKAQEQIRELASVSARNCSDEELVKVAELAAKTRENVSWLALVLLMLVMTCKEEEKDD